MIRIWIRSCYTLSLPSYKNFRETSLYARENLSCDDVKNALSQRELIEKQLIQRQNRSTDGLFIRGRTNDNSSI